MLRFKSAVISAAVLATSIASIAKGAAIGIAPLSTFGGGDGWLAPGEGGYTFLGTASLERGIAFGNNHVYLVSRNGATNNIRILDSSSGVDLGGLNNTGITGGTNPVNQVSVGGDGAIYVCNLTVQSTTTPFKVYRWATEASVPTTPYSGNGGLAGSRLGDDMAIIGSGASTRLAAGYNSTPAVTGNNSYAIVDTTAGTANAIAFAGTPPNAGDLRLGITFSDSSHVIGTAGSSLYRYTSFSGTTGTLIASPAIPDPAGAAGDRLLAYATVGGMNLLAVQSITDAHVSIYDVTNPAAPVYLVSGNNTSGTLVANSGGTGELAWNITSPTTATLYAMSTNQGIEAFTIAVPEPATMSLAAVGFTLLIARRRGD